MTRPIALLTAVLLILAFIASGCGMTPTPVQHVQVESISVVENVESPRETVTPNSTATLLSPTEESSFASPTPISAGQPAAVGQPAGCLSSREQAQMKTSQEMLAYADRLLNLGQPLADRQISTSWNGVEKSFSQDSQEALTFTLGGMRYNYEPQNILNALHVAGFAAWLRENPEQGLHILAVPLLDSNWEQGAWAPYIRAYWHDRQSTPAGDPDIIPALKLPPCRWMVEQGFAPPVDSTWWQDDPLGWPDYASAGPAYLADSTEKANQVARKIDWLGPGGEGAATMCGPLAWALMEEAGTFPPGMGGWSAGPKSFWLAKPNTNGRPWSLFAPESYHVYHFDQPLGKFDFGSWPLYPGDFFYTYSRGDGFDHMVLVTEVDQDGNVWAITNRVWEQPEKKFTIERVVLANLNDPNVGVAKVDWASDRLNGRTGHAGFDVFRWAWVDKEVSGEAAAYIVQPGDTPGLVAARWRTPVEVIVEYNQIRIDEDLSLGQQIWIPPSEDR